MIFKLIASGKYKVVNEVGIITTLGSQGCKTKYNIVVWSADYFLTTSALVRLS
ncbi:hypothetical protein VCRA2121O391_300031 [Vibrio crassostreae]|nr:hypothetical protein VCRA2117O378_320031 [Vibrio crassostreae]CAK2062648.1 hypothetical protein VCRA2113O356_370029 [Vibrio crassostreae]CAK2349134.1 hypothetical protein VCRA2119O386_340031 [Vibrio crassostreae]CAK2750883.1 hypothetical protein VCRA2117O375_290032 [Vibrio crassostreae]CAK2867120.1 hypothetical protein VCRA2121O391_300031 [Vibrio crassostreae]